MQLSNRFFLCHAFFSLKILLKGQWLMEDKSKIFLPVGRYVNIFLDMTTYEQLKLQAANERRTIAKEARHIIEQYFESDEKDKQ